MVHLKVKKGINQVLNAFKAYTMVDILRVQKYFSIENNCSGCMEKIIESHKTFLSH